MSTLNDFFYCFYLLYHSDSGVLTLRIGHAPLYLTKWLVQLQMLVSVVSLHCCCCCIDLLYDPLHLFFWVENNWITDVDPPCSCVLAWNVALVHLPSALSERDLQHWFMSWEDFDVRSDSCTTREEGDSLLVSDLSSQSPPLISACWPPFGAIACQVVTDLCAIDFVHTGFLWNGGKSVCNLKTDR